MTREEACLYLGISPYYDLDCDKIAECYKLKASMYSLDRFQLGSQEYIEAQKMLTNIKEARNFLLSSCDSQQAISNTKSQHTNIPLIATIAVVVFMLLCFALGSTGRKENTSSQITIPVPDIVINPTADYASLVERAMPSMILIQTDKGNGSGFFVSPNGDILTNYHVINDAGYITVTTQGGQNVSALVKDYDAQRDMALLKVNTSYALPYLRISSTFPRQGERIISIGNPKGFQGTVSDGIISAYRTDGNNNLWMQFTAPVSQGSSGGALINLQGEVVGMTTLNYEGQNLNFAIPCKVMQEFLVSAINKTARIWARPAQPKTILRKQAPKVKKSSKGSGIPLPDAKGFLVHKWGVQYREYKTICFLTIE